MAAAVQDSGSSATTPVEAKKVAAAEDKNRDLEEGLVSFMEREKEVISCSCREQESNR